MLTLLTSLAFAAPPELTWALSLDGRPVGTRTVTVKVVPGENGTRRIMESYTSVAGAVGPVKVTFKQRMTAHAEGGDPASFHSVVEQGGQASEIQGRFTPGGWTVSTNINGRVRTAEFAPAQIDLSTADLLDPESRVGLSRAGGVSLLSAETGEVLEGTVSRLDATEITIAGTPVSVQGYAWASPEGTSKFWFSPEGYLVRYQVQTFGVPIEGVLTAPPPAGIDDFPVRVGSADVERIPL
ncbi:MAG: hypothetical protein H6736_22845 [Alphaproteobacteria bacterium]|nr:hypothetical protein [Alphaproteobacteria bacterium]